MKKNYFIKKQNLGLSTFVLFLCVLFANSITAQKNIGWTGATNNNWSTASNWNYPAITSAGFFVTNSPTVTLLQANTEIAVGDKVAGFGIPVGATVVTIDATKKIITISANTMVAIATPGTNLAFTFAVPKAATGAPTFEDIALISNGGNPTLSPGTYSVAGVTISNATGPITGSTLTIPSGVEFNVLSTGNETVLLKGGNIINNGTLNATCGFSGGAANLGGGYAMTCGLPAVVPTVPTEYSYSGSGALNIDSSSGNNFSGGIMFNGANADGDKATYKFLFNGTTDLYLSSFKSATNTANTHFIRAVGISALKSCKVIIGGAGFNIGSESSGAVNGLIAASGGGVDVTIAPETTINVFSDSNNPMALMTMYAYGATSIDSFIRNKGTINLKGLLVRSPVNLSTEYNGRVNFVNEGILNIDANSVSSSQAGIGVTNNSTFLTPNLSQVNVINIGTLTIKTLLNAASAGTAITVSTFNGTPNVHIDNSGTLNLTGSTYSFGAKVYDPVTTLGTRLTNSGTINTNQEFRTFYTTNTSTGKITFLSTPATNKFATLTVATTVNAQVGDTYTDPNLNVHTVVQLKAGTGTSLLTNVAYNAIIPTTPIAPATTVILTKTSGVGDATIIYTAQASNGTNALFQNTLNSGVINTNTGTTAMTGVTGVKTEAPTSVLSPGGDTGKGIMVFTKVQDAYTLRGTIKMQASGATTAGVDYDLIDITGTETTFDISTAILDVTGIYKPTVAVTIDIMKTNTTEVTGGAISGVFASVVGLTPGWSVNYVTGIGGKVQLTFDPALSTSSPAFSNFKFSYYPNPTRNEVNIAAEKNISKVELFNILGQKVQSNIVNTAQKQLNIAHLQKGLYLMEVTIDNTKQTFKIMKQ